MSNPILSQSTRLLSKNGYKIGNPLYGEGMIKLGDELNFQAYQRGKRCHTAYFSQSHYQTANQNATGVNPNGVGNVVSPVLNYITKNDTDTIYNAAATAAVFRVPFRSSPSARFLSLEIGYHSAAHQKHNVTTERDSQLRIRLERTFTGELLDIGFKATINQGTLLNTFGPAYYRTLQYIDVPGGIAPAMLTQEYSNVYDSTPVKLNTGAYFAVPSDGIAFLPPDGTLPADYPLYQGSPRPLYIPSGARGGDVCIFLECMYARPVSITLIESYEETAI